MPRIVASIEARFASSRLPGKVLAPIGGRPTLGRIVDRLRSCRTLDGVILATSSASTDDVVAAWAKVEGIPCYRGSEEDVLDRVVQAHRFMNSDIVVEVCGDCPLIDAHVIDMAVDTFLANDCDVVSNTSKLTFPQGVDAQVFRLADLARISETVSDPAVREHVSLHFYEHPDQYRIIHLVAPPGWRGANLRFQLDYPEDLTFIRAVYERLEPKLGGCFGVGDVLRLLEAEPALVAINRHCEERSAR